MNYFVKRDVLNCLVIEKSTEQVIAQSIGYSEARDFAKKLNSGSGFDGWTPAFILQGTVQTPRH